MTRTVNRATATLLLLVAGILSGVVTPPECGVAAAAAARRPHVVLILVDDMGYGDIGSYGAPDIRTPHLDRLAREGVRLTDFYANGPVCTPTRAALMTGRWQQRVGLEWALLPTDRDAGLPASETSLARMLKDNGYRTALFGKWHLGFKPEFNPTRHGFDEFFGLLGGNVDMNSHRNRFGTHDLYEGTREAAQSGYLTDLITERSVKFIERPGEGQNRSRDPFFLYVAYNAVHWPFQPPGDANDVRDEKTWYDGTRADYARMLEAMDAGVGRILAALDRQGLAKDTLVIFTNDNGGERLSRNAPLFHHKGTLWEGGIRVPCLLRWPGQLPAGKVSAWPAITMDLTATILVAAGVAPPAGRALDGVDMLPILRGRRPATPRTFFWRIDRQGHRQKAVRHGDWKYIQDGISEMLIDLKRDVGERRDLRYEHPQVLADLRDRLARWEKEMDQSAPPIRIK